MPHRTAFAGYIYIEGKLARRAVAACVGSAREPPQYKPRDVFGITSPPATHLSCIPFEKILYRKRVEVSPGWTPRGCTAVTMTNAPAPGEEIWHQVSEMEDSLTTVRQIIWTVTGANSLGRQLCDTQRVSRAGECAICAERKVSDGHLALWMCKWRLQRPINIPSRMSGRKTKLYTMEFNRDAQYAKPWPRSVSITVNLFFRIEENLKHIYQRT